MSTTAREETAAARQRLLQAAIDAHNDLITGTEELKRKRSEAFKRAVYSRLVTRKELGEAVNMAVRTVSLAMNGK